MTNLDYSNRLDEDTGGISPFQTGGSWISRLRAGDEGQANLLWHRFSKRLIALAQQKLQMSPQRLGDGEDVVISAFNSFFRAIDEKRVSDTISQNELWQLLVTLTARKVIKLLRQEHRLRRDSAKLLEDQDLDAILSQEPSPEFITAMAQQYQWLQQQLVDEQMREVVHRRLEGYSNAEIAQHLDCSVRTVKRRLALTQAILQQALNPYALD